MTPLRRMSTLLSCISSLCNKNWFCFLAIVCTAILTIILPTLAVGLHASGDTFVYLNFAQEIKDAFADGHWFPGWANDNAGFGSVGIRFYPPIALYSLALLSRLTGEFYYALVLMFFIWTIVGCWGMYLCVRELATPRHGLFAGLVYAIVPFHLAEIYRHSLIAEFVAGAILPYCLWLLIKVYRGGTWRTSSTLAVALAGVALTHIPTTIITSISFAVLIAVMARRTSKRTLVQLLWAGFGCIGLTAFYLCRVLPELGWVAHSSSEYASGGSSPAANLFPMTPFVDPSKEYAIPVYRNIDTIVLLTLLFFVPALLRSFSSRKSCVPDRWDRAIVVSAGFGFLMLSRVSTWVWETAPLIYRIQFPWRWLGILSIFAVISLAISFETVRNFRKPLRGSMAALVAIVGIIVLSYDIRQSFASTNTASRNEINELLLYRDRQAGTTLQAWWPAWAKPEALADAARVSAPGRSVEISEWSRTRRRFAIGPGDSADVRVATFYYPLWRGIAGSELVAPAPNPDGTLSIPVGPGRSEIELTFEEPLRARIGSGISLAVLAMLLVVMASSRPTARDRRGNPPAL